MPQFGKSATEGLNNPRYCSLQSYNVFSRYPRADAPAQVYYSASFFLPLRHSLPLPRGHHFCDDSASAQTATRTLHAPYRRIAAANFRQIFWTASGWRNGHDGKQHVRVSGQFSFQF